MWVSGSTSVRHDDDETTAAQVDSREARDSRAHVSAARIRPASSRPRSLAPQPQFRRVGDVDRPVHGLGAGPLPDGPCRRRRAPHALQPSGRRLRCEPRDSGASPGAVAPRASPAQSDADRQSFELRSPETLTAAGGGTPGEAWSSRRCRRIRRSRHDTMIWARQTSRIRICPRIAEASPIRKHPRSSGSHTLPSSSSSHRNDNSIRNPPAGLASE